MECVTRTFAVLALGALIAVPSAAGEWPVDKTHAPRDLAHPWTPPPHRRNRPTGLA